jgi:uncharacterized protein
LALVDPLFMAQAGILLAASFVQGVTGFAFSLLSLPLLSLAMPAREIVPMLTLFGLVLNAMVLLSVRGSARPLQFLPLYAAGLAFTWPGIVLLRVLPDRPVKLLAGILVLATALLYLKGRGFRTGTGPVAQAATGALSGILNGLTTFSGPPVVLLLMGSGAERDGFRANLSLYFLALNAFSIPLMISSGLIRTDLAVECARLSPFVVAGAVAGSVAASRTGQARFRKTVLIVLAACGLVAAAASI